MTGTVSTTATREVEFHPSAATVDAIQRAAYRLSDRLAVDIDRGETIRCTLLIQEEAAADELAVAFRIEVLDQVLRERIREETAATRNVILALAFSQTGTVTAD